jgi:hypothetical protein
LRSKKDHAIRTGVVVQILRQRLPVPKDSKLSTDDIGCEDWISAVYDAEDASARPDTAAAAEPALSEPALSEPTGSGAAVNVAEDLRNAERIGLNRVWRFNDAGVAPLSEPGLAVLLVIPWHKFGLSMA